MGTLKFTITIDYLQENFGQSSKPAKASLWSENTGVSSGKKNSSILIKKSNIGIKINAKSSQSKTSKIENTVFTDKETILQLDKTLNTSTSTSNTVNIDTKSDVGNILPLRSLVGAYSDSSDNDSD